MVILLKLNHNMQPNHKQLFYCCRVNFDFQNITSHNSGILDDRLTMQCVLKLNLMQYKYDLKLNITTRKKHEKMFRQGLEGLTDGEIENIPQSFLRSPQKSPCTVERELNIPKSGI